MRKTVIGTVCGLLLLAAVLTAIPSTVHASLQRDGQRLIERFPARDALERDQLAAGLVALGSKGIREVCARLVPPGMGDDAKARFALHALVTHVRRPGAEKDRIMVARAFHKALKLTPHKSVRAFLIGQLQLAGGHESVKPLKAYLRDPRLCEPAARALLAIGNADAESALIKALKNAKRKNQVTLVRALGQMRSLDAVKGLLKLADTQDAELREVTRFALANIGDPRAESILEQLPVNAPARERLQAPQLILLYLQRRAEAGDIEKSVASLKRLLRNYSSDFGSPVPGRALDLMVTLRGEEAFDDLLSAMDSADAEFRGQALALAGRIPGEAATARWLKRLDEVPPDVQIEIIAMLGGRGDRTAVPVLKRLLSHDQTEIRMAAIPAAANLAGEEVLPELLALLEFADEEEIEMIKQACLRMPGNRLVSEAARLLDISALPVQVALIEILASRRAREYSARVFAHVRSEHPELRRAALTGLADLVSKEDLPLLIDLLRDHSDRREILLIQAALIEAAAGIEEREARAGLILAELDRNEGERRSDFMAPLARIGGGRALAAVVSAIEGDDPGLRTAAVHTLVRWEDAEAMPALLALARSSSSAKNRYLALQGYLRLAGAADVDHPTRFDIVSRVMDIPITVEDKRLLLAGLTRVRTPAALEAAADFLTDSELTERARATIIRIALPHLGEPGLQGAAVLALLERIEGEIEDEYTREMVLKYIDDLREESEFRPLFNGNDLTGWTGDFQGYAVRDGVIMVLPGSDTGNLYTADEYADFILRFEFRLTPGANNGLGIRAPLEGDAAYVGMEIQILDDSAPQYSDLEPYQFHGSIYGVVPARKGHQNAVGEWNREEVIARGSRITVRLNGVTIVDEDVAEASRKGTLDGRPHPGLERASGHIGFLGHGSRVDFRNIRLKVLK